MKQIRYGLTTLALTALMLIFIGVGVLESKCYQIDVDLHHNFTIKFNIKMHENNKINKEMVLVTDLDGTLVAFSIAIHNKKV